MDEKAIFKVEVPEFTGANVPIEIVAKVMRKDVQFVRLGLQTGYLPFGVATKKEGSSQYNYYISPFKFWQYTGFIYKGGEDDE